MYTCTPLVLKASHVNDSAFCMEFLRLDVPEQALDGTPLGLGLVVKISMHSNTESVSKT